MTQLLTEAIRIANTLSEEDQNAIALTLLQVIRDRQSLTQTKTQVPDPEILNYMEQQAEIFNQKKPELLNQYLGKYILFENGKIIDADNNESALAQRTIAKNGLKPMFIKKVVTEEPKLSIRGFKPFLRTIS